MLTNKDHRELLNKKQQFTKSMSMKIKIIASMVNNPNIGAITYHIYRANRHVRKEMMQQFKSKKEPRYRKSHGGKSLFKMSIDEVRNLLGNYDGINNYRAFNGYTFSIKRMPAFFHMGFTCVACGKEGTYFSLDIWRDNGLHLDLYSEDGTMMTIDHIIPKSKGGPNSLDNYQCMCKICNEKKGNKMPDEVVNTVD